MDSEFLNEEGIETVSLKGGLDLTDLRNNQGVTFEVREEEGLKDEPTDNTYFDTNEVCKNLYTGDSDEEHSDDEDTPFERLKRKMVDVCPEKDGGVMKQVLKEGSGPVVPPGSIVRVHFNGYFEYADEPFDSSRLRNTVLKFRLGRGEVIEGWDIAVSTMRKGEFSRFLIMPEYFLGPMGSPPRIPKEAPALFEIELLSFVERAGPDDFFNMTREERWEVPFAEVKKIYHSIVSEAKQMFANNYIRGAFPKYKKACTILEDVHLKNEEEEEEQQKLLVRVYTNLAICLIKQGHAQRVIFYCRRCEEIEKNNPKVLYLHGKALHLQADFNRARDFMKRAQKIKPSNKDINEELEKIEEDMQKFKLLERDLYQKMFSKPKGETKEEKESSEKIITEKIDKSLKCSDDFQKMVLQKLEEFKTNKDLLEMPLPSFEFTVGEINCILETAEKVGLDTKVIGTGNRTHIRVFKKEPDINT